MSVVKRYVSPEERDADDRAAQSSSWVWISVNSMPSIPAFTSPLGDRARDASTGTEVAAPSGGRDELEGPVIAQVGSIKSPS